MKITSEKLDSVIQRFPFRDPAWQRARARFELSFLDKCSSELLTEPSFRTSEQIRARNRERSWMDLQCIDDGTVTIHNTVSVHKIRSSNSTGIADSTWLKRHYNRLGIDDELTRKEKSSNPSESIKGVYVRESRKLSDIVIDLSGSLEI